MCVRIRCAFITAGEEPLSGGSEEVTVRKLLAIAFVIAAIGASLAASSASGAVTRPGCMHGYGLGC